MSGFTGKPWSRSHSSDSRWLSNSIPSSAPTEYAQIDSGRDAVTPESSWRIEPAAVLRGFA